MHRKKRPKKKKKKRGRPKVGSLCLNGLYISTGRSVRNCCRKEEKSLLSLGIQSMVHEPAVPESPGSL